MYIKHLINCFCWLPQFEGMENKPFHMFVAFSELLHPSGEVKPSFAQCNNCGRIHKVIEIGKSVLTSKDDSHMLPKKTDIKAGLPQKFVEVLESYNCELITWQEVEHIINNSMWGTPVIIKREQIDGMMTGKYMIILGENMLKIDSFFESGDEDE